ncbi:hypothetical protein TrispH2_009355 [Trichoplax sp. H2]|nr:hypothetical protein TrispH2_009355 [Trichoplax sp. H2]|eukprot:RDD38445.1 hypothetical protein TrispH2_009355 [Trichoplax sp. H2]
MSFIKQGTTRMAMEKASTANSNTTAVRHEQEVEIRSTPVDQNNTKQGSTDFFAQSVRHTEKNSRIEVPWTDWREFVACCNG